MLMAGVDDFWHGRPDLGKALDGAKPTDACVLLCHNPDFAESISDRRVGLVLSGHTHGGQLILPGYGSPVVPSRYGQKYAHGLVEAPATTVYVSRGIGMSGLPVRANCRPEITLLTLS
jgi:predicted MPP superfamily phosphohydrolase